MWNTQTEQLEGGRVLRYSIAERAGPARYSDVLRLWRRDAGFRSFFNALLADVPFAAYRWETPPVTTSTVDRRFEFVVLDRPGLARTADPDAFSDHFAASAHDETVVVFPNLRHDALLVVPCPGGPPTAYGHIGSFVRDAPDAQKHALWRAVGQTLEQRLGAAPIWLSTAGAGVPWLHVRLDETPKYYGFGPYKVFG